LKRAGTAGLEATSSLSVVRPWGAIASHAHAMLHSRFRTQIASTHRRSFRTRGVRPPPELCMEMRFIRLSDLRKRKGPERETPNRGTAQYFGDNHDHSTRQDRLWDGCGGIGAERLCHRPRRSSHRLECWGEALCPDISPGWEGAGRDGAMCSAERLGTARCTTGPPKLNRRCTTECTRSARARALIQSLRDLPRKPAAAARHRKKCLDPVAATEGIVTALESRVSRLAFLEPMSNDFHRCATASERCG